ncbi:MAG: hypothetical protein LBV50_07090 [Novosphingobium sp.]|nr:hypothetical protein [Novosphingobium sp.]
MEDDFISCIYESAVIPEKWIDVIEKFALRVGARGGNLIRNTGSEISLLPTPAIIEDVNEFECQGWQSENTRVSRLLERSQYRGFLTDLDLHTQEEIRTFPMYTEFLTPRGVDAGAATIIQGSKDQILAIAFEGFSSHDAAASAVPILDAVRPHLVRAVSLSGEIANAKAASLLDAFDTVGLAVGLLDIAGRLIDATRLFATALNDLLYDGPDRLHTGDPASDKVLSDALAVLRGGGGAINCPPQSRIWRACSASFAPRARRGARSL